MLLMILLVDDSKTLRNVLKVYLMEFGLAFIEAADGRQALELLKTSKVQLVIADINMPGMDGLTFLRRLRADEQPHLRKLPVILLTANKPEEYRARGLAAGANAFLQKPVVSTALVETARQFLSS